MSREVRPKTKGEAKSLIERTFRFNRWDADEIKRYLKMLRFENMNWKEFESDDLRIILDDFEKAKMILFE